MGWFKKKRRPVRFRPRYDPTVRGIYDPGGREVLGPDGTKYPNIVSLYSGLETADASIWSDLRELKRASRIEAARGGHLRAAVLTFQREVVGGGIHLHSLHPNREVGAEVERLWNKWAADMADASGQQSLRSLLHTMVASLIIDGEILVREHWENGYQLMAIDTGMLRAQETLPLEDGKFVRMGVEMDEMRRPVAYWITDAPLRNIVSGYTTQARGYPAERIIHVFEHTMPMQTRGVPWAYATLRRFQEIREYDESERKAAKLASNMYANYEPPAMDPLAGNIGLGAAPGTEPAGGRPPTPGAGPSVDGKVGVGVRDDPGEAAMPGVMEPGTIFPVQPGGKLNLHSPEHPNTAYPDYIRANYQAAASAMGISYAAMTGDLSQANFVSSRMGRLAERGTIEMVQNMVIEKVLLRAYRKWLLDMALRGMLPAAPLEELEMVEFVPPAHVHVQPRETAAAWHQLLEDGLASRAELIRERGRDPQTVFMEIEQEAAMMPEPEPEPEPAGGEAPPPEGESGLGDKRTRDEARRLAAEGVSQSELGRRYGVTRQAIAKLLAGHTHKMDARAP